MTYFFASSYFKKNLKNFSIRILELDSSEERKSTRSPLSNACLEASVLEWNTIISLTMCLHFFRTAPYLVWNDYDIFMYVFWYADSSYLDASICQLKFRTLTVYIYYGHLKSTTTHRESLQSYWLVLCLVLPNLYKVITIKSNFREV